MGPSIEACHLRQPLRVCTPQGIPPGGTGAGMIALARHASGLPFPALEAIDIEVDRNAYGRQVDSFEADLDVPALGAEPFHAVFIRAPVVTSAGESVEVLATVQHDGEPASPVAVRQGTLLATSFHPELTPDSRFHEYFLDIVRSQGRISAAK